MNSMQTIFALLPNLGAPEIVLILLLCVLLFGAKKLPELARGLGKSIKEFKKATSSVEEDIRSAIEEEPPAVPKKTVDEKEKTAVKD